jgi:hypothetical protein
MPNCKWQVPDYNNEIFTWMLAKQRLRRSINKTILQNRVAMEIEKQQNFSTPFAIINNLS